MTELSFVCPSGDVDVDVLNKKAKWEINIPTPSEKYNQYEDFKMILLDNEPLIVLKKNNYINASAICERYKKNIKKFLRDYYTKMKLLMLTDEIGNSSIIFINGNNLSKRKNCKLYKGYYMHADILYLLYRWCDVMLAYKYGYYTYLSKYDIKTGQEYEVHDAVTKMRYDDKNKYIEIVKKVYNCGSNKIFAGNKFDVIDPDTFISYVITGEEYKPYIINLINMGDISPIQKIIFLYESDLSPVNEILKICNANDIILRKILAH